MFIYNLFSYSEKREEGGRLEMSEREATRTRRYINPYRLKIAWQSELVESK